MSEIITSKRKGRKAAVAEPVAIEPAVPTVAPQQPMMLTRDELHKMRLFEVEARAARAEAEVCRLRKKWILALIDTKSTVEAEEKKQAKHIEKAKDWARKHELVIAQVSARLGVDLKTCGFDPETGVVVPDMSAKGTK